MRDLSDIGKVLVIYFGIIMIISSFTILGFIASFIRSIIKKIRRKENED